MATEKPASQAARMKAQGYCKSNHAPRCGCCIHFPSVMYGAICNDGNIQVSHSGWCPSWSPRETWRKQNQHVVNLFYKLETLAKETPI